MQAKNRHYAIALAGALAALASASSMACTLAPTSPLQIKQMMATEIAHRLGVRPQQIPLDAITHPQLHTPLGLGADCSGLAAYHHSAGFRIPASPRQGPRPWPGRDPDPEPGPDPDPGPDPWPGAGPERDVRPGPPWSDRRPRRCVHEGVAVVLGYGYSSPVAVHFERRCR